MRLPRPALLGSLILAAACASATISSIAAPESAGHTYHRVLVLAPTGDLAVRKAVEEAFIEWSKDSGTRFTAGYKLFFPGRGYAPAEVAQVLRTNGIDGVLVLESRNGEATSTYVPPTFKLTCTQWFSSTGCVQTQGASSSDAPSDQPWSNFSARLFDATSGAVAWIATGSGGSSLTGSAGLYRGIAERTVHQLGADRLAVARTATATDSAAAIRAAEQDQQSRAALGRP